MFKIGCSYTINYRFVLLSTYIVSLLLYVCEVPRFVRLEHAFVFPSLTTKQTIVRFSFTNGRASQFITSWNVRARSGAHIETLLNSFIRRFIAHTFCTLPPAHVVVLLLEFQIDGCLMNEEIQDNSFLLSFGFIYL